RCCRTNEIFAVARAGHSASLIVRLSACANHRRIADSSGHFVCRPARRSRRGQITVLIKCNGTDSAVSILIGDEKTCPLAAGAMFFRSLNLPQGLPSVLGKEIFL